MSLDSIEIPGTPINVEGTKHFHDIFMFALSTCQWCKKGKRWLQERSYAYTYLDIDTLKLAVKTELKKKLRKEFDTRLTFPFLVVDKSQILPGFNPDDWEAVLS